MDANSLGVQDIMMKEEKKEEGEANVDDDIKISHHF